jgi:hypothetical protein
MHDNYDYETIAAYEFMLPIAIERFRSDMALEYRIPIENVDIFGNTRQRMQAMRIALDYIRARKRIQDEIKAYEQEFIQASNWGSSSVILSDEFMQTISDGIKESQAPIKKQLDNERQNLDNITNEAKHKIRVIYVGR